MTTETPAGEPKQPHDYQWIHTFTGRKFWPLEPRARDVSVIDIAHALAYTCRFSGHMVDFYTVAQHSVIVSYFVPDHWCLHGLLHDAAEAYLTDLVTPIKRQLPDYRDHEARVTAAVFEVLGVWPAEVPPAVHAVDFQCTCTEARDLMTGDERDWPHWTKPLPITLVPGPWARLRDRFPWAPPLRFSCWTPRQAERMFLRRYRQLTKEPQP